MARAPAAMCSDTSAAHYSAPMQPEEMTSKGQLVVHVIDEFLRGSETFVYTQLRLQRDFRTTVLTRRRVNTDRFPYADVRELEPRSNRYTDAVARRVHRWSGRESRFQRRIASTARELRCDVLHAHFGWSGLEALPAARQMGVPLLTAFHGRDVYSPGGGVPADVLYRSLFADGALFTCVGPNARHALEDLGCPTERIEIVKVGLDLEQFVLRDEAALAPEFTVVQVSRFTDKKGIDVTIRAFALARKQLGEGRLWLIGDGPLKDSLVRLASDLGVEEAIDFRGALPHDEVREALRRAHVGVQPSRTAPNGDKEGSPTVLLEMQATGVPVAATLHADIPSIVACPDELVDEDDAEGLAERLVALAAMSRAEREARAVAGRELVEYAHDARAIAEQLARLYRRMTGS